jgi:hypothetical protein
MKLQALTLDQLHIRDEAALLGMPVYRALKRRLLADGYRFRVPAPGEDPPGWGRTVFLNLTWWNAAEAQDVLEGPEIDADVVAHVGWHHCLRAHLGADAASADGLFFGEAVASAFDLYLIGGTLGVAPGSTLLETQVPLLVDTLADAGLDAEDAQALLEDIAEDPVRAFEDLRALLFGLGTSLVHAKGVDEAVERLHAVRRHRFAPLVHRFELSNWLLYARAWAPDALGPRPRLRQLDRELRDSPNPLALLCEWCDLSSEGA